MLPITKSRNISPSSNESHSRQYRGINLRRLRLGLAQINPTVGDFPGNSRKIIDSINQASPLGIDILTFPELAICGYPPEDLLFKPSFLDANMRCLNKIIEASAGLTVIVGFVDASADIYNAAAIIHDGKLVDVYHKIYLPNYGVFDEDRYFRAGNECPVYTIGGVGVGVNICEDIWYATGPATMQADQGAEVIINISSSPYYFGRTSARERMLATRATDNVAIIAYNNIVGGQDELVFDGDSIILDEKGNIIARGKQFAEDLIVADLDVDSVFRARLHDPRSRKTLALTEDMFRIKRVSISEEPVNRAKPPLQPVIQPTYELSAEIYHALVLGTHDYVTKNGFNKVVIGLSGGIDSSLVATVAVDALGAENVTGVSMPSRYSSRGSVEDAQQLIKNLGIRLLTIPIEKAFQAYLDMLSDAFAGTEPNVSEENIQARIRGNILMALSNKFDWIVLTTGNKSEMATGYSTLYGDMAGGFDVLKDVPKTTVYKLARYKNKQAGYDIIPPGVLAKPPSAELRPGQLDTDTLPPFDILDPILTAYVEEDRSTEQIVALGYEADRVSLMATLVDLSEYKRRQAPPGVKITSRAFGRDRRLPITNRFRGSQTGKSPCE